MKTEIRHATPEDIPTLIQLGRLMHFESRYSRFNFDPIKYGAVLRAIMPQGLTFVAECGGQIAGVFAGRVEEHFFGNDLAAWDLLTYVMPEHRGGLIGYRLIREYLRWTELWGIDDVHIGHSTGLTPERIGKLYERLGFRLVGGGYVLER